MHAVSAEEPSAAAGQETAKVPPLQGTVLFTGVLFVRGISQGGFVIVTMTPRRVIAVAAMVAAAAVGTSACGTASAQARAAHLDAWGTGTASHGSAAAVSASRDAGHAVAAVRQASAAAVGRGLLREFLTVHNQGYFYTAYTPEAQAAVRKYHFRPTGATFGYVDGSHVKGTIPLYRLHVVGRQAYIVTPDVREKNSLLASHKFTLDGVLGFIATKHAAGTFAIWRLGKGPQPYWRLATTAQEKVLVRQGWHLDGLVGYVWAKS